MTASARPPRAKGETPGPLPEGLDGGPAARSRSRGAHSGPPAPPAGLGSGRGTPGGAVGGASVTRGAPAPRRGLKGARHLRWDGNKRGRRAGGGEPGAESATLWRGRGRIANARRPQADPPTGVGPWTAASSAKKAAGLGGQRLTVGRPTSLCPAPRGPGLGAWEPQPEVLASGPEAPRRKPTAALHPHAGPAPQRPGDLGFPPTPWSQGQGRAAGLHTPTAAPVRVRTAPLRPGRGWCCWTSAPPRPPVVKVRTVPLRPGRGVARCHGPDCTTAAQAGVGVLRWRPTTVVPLAPSRTYHHPRWGSGQ